MSNIVQLNFVRSRKMHDVDMLWEYIAIAIHYNLRLKKVVHQQATETSLNSVLSLYPQTKTEEQSYIQCVCVSYNIKSKCTYPLIQ